MNALPLAALLVATTVLARDASAGASLDAVHQDHGAITPAVREASLGEAESIVQRELAGVGVTLSDEQLGWIRGDPVLRRAAYGAVHPPDPRIALNLLELRKQLGAEYFAAHSNLLVAGAVARRHVGVGPDALSEKEEWALRGPAEAFARTGAIRWPEYSVVQIRKPAVIAAPPEDKAKKDPPPSRIARKRREKWENHLGKLTDPEGLDVIAAFLKAKAITPRQLYESPALKQEMLAQLGERAPDSGTITHALLMKAMTRAGLRPAQRDPFPSLADFSRFLDEIEPRFPVKSAPWPLLMPLAKGWPLKEARDIQRRVELGGKLPTYGKYQKKELAILEDLEPSPWHWESWQGTYQAGGVCHEMSTIGLGTYMSIGVPVTKAGQPHHSCILVYSHSSNGYFVGTKQGTKGPSSTRSQWLFADPRVELPQLYHMGLALAMNVGLDAYLDSRLGVTLARQLAADGETALAATVLRQAAARNPYNVEVWAALCDERPAATPEALHKAEVIRLAISLISTRTEDVLAYREKPTDVSLENESDEDYADSNPRKWTATFLQVLGRELLLPGVVPTVDHEINARILKLLHECAGSGIEVQRLVSAFENAAP